MTAKCPHPEKVRYASRGEALRAALALRKHRMASPDVKPYYCRCERWHIGHSQESLIKRIRRARRGR